MPAACSRPVRAAAACLLLLALALSGCTAEAPRLEGAPGPGAPGAGPPSGEEGGAANASFDAPAVWEVGRWWRYRTPAGEDTRAVASDAGGAYVVGTSNEAVAYFDARSDISTVGRIRKADLAGEQRGAAVEMYRFPLVANSTWTTTWDGASRTVSVLGPGTAAVAGRSLPSMRLEAREGDRVAVRYDYVPAVGWFSSADFTNADGSTFGLAVTAYGTGFNGTLLEARVTELYRDAASGPLKPAGQFDAPAGAAYLDVQWAFAGDTVAYEIGFRASDGFQTGFQVGPCAGNCSLSGNLTLPPTPGTWGVGALGAVQGGQQQRASASLSVAAVEFLRRPVG